MKIIIVRHGQTDENLKEGDAARDSETLLTKEGEMQAKKLGTYLKNHKITHAYTSPQKRAVYTTQEVLAHHKNANIEQSDDLREQNLGDLSLLPKNSIRKLHEESGKPFHDFRPENGESYGDVQRRAAKFFHELLQKHHHDDTVLIVSHGGTVGMLLLHLLEKEITEENYKAYKPSNTATTIIDISKEGAVDLKVINDLKHLDETV